MKAVLEFNLPEEQEEFQMATKASSTIGGAQEFDNYLRSKLKYEELTPEQYEIYEAVRTKLHECMEDIW